MSVIPLAAGAAPQPVWAERLAVDLESRASRLSGVARRVRAGGDSDAVHDLRVATRRLEAALRLWRDSLPAKPARAARRRLRRMRRAVGRTRELEVDAALLRERLPNAAESAREPLATLLRSLERRVARGQRKAAQRAAKDRVRAIERRLTRIATALRESAVPSDGVAAATARAEVAGDRARDAIATARATIEDPVLHRARIEVKKWRYAEESLAAVTGSAPETGATLREVQQSLGAIHDHAMLRDLLLVSASRWRDRGRPAHAAALGALIAALEQERLHEVLRFRARVGVLLPSPAAP